MLRNKSNLFYLTWPRCCNRKPLGTTSNSIRNSCDTRPIGNISSDHLLSSLPLRSIGTHDDAVVVSYELTGSMTMRSLPFLLPLWWANISSRHVSLVIRNVGDLSVRIVVVGSRRKCRKLPKQLTWEWFLLISNAIVALSTQRRLDIVKWDVISVALHKKWDQHFCLFSLFFIIFKNKWTRMAD